MLASMEFYGVKADAEGIKAFGEDLKIKIDELTSVSYTHLDVYKRQLFTL